VLTLVDASNHSATLRFAALLQQHRLGTLVGQRTGGSQRGINGGAFFFMRLPASGLEVDLPLIGSFAPSGRPATGLTPDVTVPLAPGDLSDGRDPVLARALALARG
jgi:C-terminal processing protease CtpA/Prc